MEYQKAVTVLKSLVEKGKLEPEEKEAVILAIGQLSWGALAESKVKEKGAKRKKSTDW
jgi:hypothetical protein